MSDNTRKYAAEVVGTFALVSSVCGAALFSVPSAGLITVALSIGVTVLAMAYAVGPISGGHFNLAVTCGLVAAGRCPAGDAIPYIVAQLFGGIAAATVFYFILSGAPQPGSSAARRRCHRCGCSGSRRSSAGSSAAISASGCRTNKRKAYVQTEAPVPLARGRGFRFGTPICC
jgi:glycerol uptake facilitator-like aquaporin